MKHFKKLKISLMAVFLLLSNAVTTICHCGRHGQDIDGQTFTFINDKKLQTRIERLELSLQHRKEENPEIIPPIIIGGRYKSVPHARDYYESHHLISAHFCRSHSDIISVQNAPSVLILKNMHKLTGSFGRNSAQYFEKEERAFRFGGLEAVLELGIEDLNQVIAQHYASHKPVVSSLEFTPYKRARAMLQEVDPTAYLEEDLSSFVTTPLKVKAKTSHSRL